MITERRTSCFSVAIGARVIPTMLRWPSSKAAKTLAWDRLRDCVEALRAMLRVLDGTCHRAEQNADLKPEAIARRRKELGDQALSKLAAFKPLLSAQRAVDESINDLDPKTQSLLTKGLDELREGVAATRRAVVERCQMSAGYAHSAGDVRFPG